MTARTLMLGSMVTAGGTVAASGAYWTLLNVPESNVPALLLSALLVVVAVVISGWTVAAVLSVACGLHVRPAVQCGWRGLPGFVLGLAAFGLLWWTTRTIDALWALHRGEIDAMFLRYAGTANTTWVHAGVAWLMWLVRWGVGLTAIGTATRGSVSLARSRGALHGLGRALSPLPLAATIGALIAARLLWRLAYWRPHRLSANAFELVFVSGKLVALFTAGVLLVVLVLHAVARVPTRADADGSGLVPNPR